jgi:hypothetical protein
MLSSLFSFDDQLIMVMAKKRLKRECASAPMLAAFSLARSELQAVGDAQ